MNPDKALRVRDGLRIAAAWRERGKHDRCYPWTELGTVGDTRFLKYGIHNDSLRR